MRDDDSNPGGRRWQSVVLMAVRVAVCSEVQTVQGVWCRCWKMYGKYEDSIAQDTGQNFE
jgi:hypothetical protein